jgi:hypothetical protein
VWPFFIKDWTAMPYDKRTKGWNWLIYGLHVKKPRGMKKHNINVQQLILGTESPHLNTALKMAAFGSQTSVASDRRVVQ